MRVFRGFLPAAVLCTAGCAPGSWGEARLMDLTDMVDVRYGTGIGLGVHADATVYLGTGLGWSSIEHSRTWFGRRDVEVQGTEFFGMGVASVFAGGPCPPDATHGWWNMFLVNVAALGGAPPVIDRFRFGAVLFLPGVHGGLHVNLGQWLDAFLGLFTLDPAGDDGIPTFASP